MVLDHRLSGLSWLWKASGRLDVLAFDAPEVVARASIFASQSVLSCILTVRGRRRHTILTINKLLRQLPVVSWSCVLWDSSAVTDRRQHRGPRRAAVHARLTRYG